MKDVMLDIETLGRGPGCVILSIGACMFGPEGVGEKFYRTIDIRSSQGAGLTIDADTLMWWQKQDDATRALSFKGEHRLHDALSHFSAWLKISALDKSFNVWGCGAEFDNSIVLHAYIAAKIYKPWEFRQNRCYRTLKNLYPKVPRPPMTGVVHHALGDAVNQAEHAIAIFNAHNLW